MKSIIRLKGHLIKLEADFAYVIEDRTDREFKFYAGELFEINEGDKVDLLISPGVNQEAVSRVLSFKNSKKANPIKMPSFNALIGHMIKTKARLEATFEASEEDSAKNDIKDKIDWLKRGIDLFRR